MTKRKYLTPKERDDMLEKQAGGCAVCDDPIGPQRGLSAIPYIAEHWVTVESGNDQKPDCLLCVPCAKIKTFGTKATSYGSDTHARAKIKRLRGETKQQPKKKIPQRANPWPPKGSRKLSSRPMERRNG